ncbi:MAG: peptidylprolyl isomerase [Thiohalocapsa sp.]|nr:peptidylprolyl isomerase [Thiohalocapsa sp.]MCF7990263.1 peptidylprolyl isomerase [Thiohalocapsa sp.]
MSDTVRQGKLVSLTYSIRSETGAVLEQSDLPVTYIHGGRNELIGGMDRRLEGKSAGAEIEFALSPELSGFGPHDPDLTFTDAIENVPPQFRHIGAEVSMHNEAGDSKTFYVTRIEDGELTVDANHPLAGKHLLVNVRILEVREPTSAECKQDLAGSPAPTLH